jgi:hypothetical protein
MSPFCQQLEELLEVLTPSAQLWLAVHDFWTFGLVSKNAIASESEFCLSSLASSLYVHELAVAAFAVILGCFTSSSYTDNSSQADIATFNVSFRHIT